MMHFAILGIGIAHGVHLIGGLSNPGWEARRLLDTADGWRKVTAIKRQAEPAVRLDGYTMT